MTSILESIKQVSGISAVNTAFDADLIMAINTAFMNLTQLGVGPDAGFLITGSEELWTDFLGDATNLSGVKTYVGLKVRQIFDPPATSFVLSAMDSQIRELEWRLNAIVDVEEEPIDEEV